MTKTLVVGDTHLKQKIVLPRVDALVERHGAGRIVLLGDYCDEWHSTDDQLMDALYFLADWVDETRASGVQVDVLLGNHDYQYLMGQEGPGTHMRMVREVRELLGDLDPAIAAEVDGFLLTHAGVTDSWAERYLDEPGFAMTACDQLNALFEGGAQEDREALFTCGAGRGGWDVPGPLWADLSELSDDPCAGFDQIVGHTPVSTCGLVPMPPADALGESRKLAACDTFSLASSLWPIGDASMLLVEDGRLTVVGGEEGPALTPWGYAVLDWTRSLF
ncbi:metallophosphoesterase [Arabiibacter massiliensis]|uniref:metallophosphoesterase n=1 Tax=Arabiibacter massiliensis TaxID=1870985 RepID=UPI0009B9F127|nr:metallophosphoesterase [Arabiibacter massiliensis]